MNISKFTKILLGAVLLTGSLVQAQADDKKVDPTGTYIWTMPGRNGGPDRTNTLVLKLDGDKLTGSVASPGRGGAAPTPVDITDGKVTGINAYLQIFALPDYQKFRSALLVILTNPPKPIYSSAVPASSQ